MGSATWPEIFYLGIVQLMGESHREGILPLDVSNNWGGINNNPNINRPDLHDELRSSMDNGISLALRRTVRLILLNEFDQILLIKIEDKTAQDPKAGEKTRPYWITPGGEIEDGEDINQALLRELEEETGLKGPAVHVGPCVGIGEHVLLWKGVPTQLHESFFVVRVDEPEVTLDAMTAHEKRVYREHKWWNLGELERSSEILLPVGIVELARAADSCAPDASPVVVDMSTPKEISS